MNDVTNAADLFESPQRLSSVEMVIERIKTLIVERKLNPGDRLPNEFELTRSLSVSRGTLREAMKILESYGIVEIRRGNGTFVSASAGKYLFEPLLFQLLFTTADRRKLRDLRELFELGLVRFVIRDAGSEQLDALEEACSVMERCVERNADPRELVEADLLFHRALGRATGNELMARIYEFVLEFFAPSIHSTYRREASGRNALLLHRAILDGLKARDPDRTVRAVKDSIGEWADLSEPEE